MPKFHGAAQARCYEAVVTFGPDGKPAGVRAASVEEDSAGNALGHIVQDYPLTDADVFSAVLGLTDTTLPGKANAAHQVAHDKVADHQAVLAAWLTQRYMTEAGL